MANHKSTLKRIRQNKIRRLRNKYIHKSTRTAIKNLKKENNKSIAILHFPKVSSMIDKLSKKGIIHNNKASRIKSQLSKRINTLNINNN